MKFIVSLLFSLSAVCGLTVPSKVVAQTAHKSEQITLSEKIKELRISMLAYMETGEVSYTEKDVTNCINILRQYTKEMDAAKSKEDAMRMVKSAILRLNELNDQCDHQLIETGEREQIAEIIISAISAKGYSSPEEDVTEQWRTW